MKHSCIPTLMAAGITHDDAMALRRISMTLHRWFELECGDGNNYGSWAIVRGHKHRITRPAASTPCTEFEHDDDGKPYLEHHHYTHGAGTDSVTYSRLADRETGARKRLVEIIKHYPGFTAYVQTDPRGCSLYILRPEDVPADADVSSCYNRGIAVYR